MTQSPIPCQQDIYDLGNRNAIIQTCLMLHRAGQLTWEESLMLMVQEQTKEYSSRLLKIEQTWKLYGELGIKQEAGNYGS